MDALTFMQLATEQIRANGGKVPDHLAEVVKQRRELMPEVKMDRVQLKQRIINETFKRAMYGPEY